MDSPPASPAPVDKPLLGGSCDEGLNRDRSGSLRRQHLRSKYESNVLSRMASLDSQMPVLPLFTQLNLRSKNDMWKEASRWVKFQEDVEDGGKRWSKPYVPALQLTALMDLKQSLDNGIIALDLEGRTVEEIVDNLYLMHDGDESRPVKVMEADHFEEVKLLLGQRVKLRMKLNLIGKMSSVASGGGGGPGANLSANSPNPSRPGSVLGLSFKSAPASRQASRESLADTGGGTGSRTTFSNIMPKIPMLESLRGKDESLSFEDNQVGVPRANSMSSSSRDKSAKLRSHNLFSKKVPKDAESCVIFATCVPFLQRPVTVFIRLSDSVILEDFCEIPAPSRFLALVLGPTGEEERIQYIGKALGTVMADQIFPIVAYRAKNSMQLMGGIDSFAKGVTVLAPSVWDHKTRLDPPKSLPSIDSRLHHMRQHSPSPLRHLSSSSNPPDGLQDDDDLMDKRLDDDFLLVGLNDSDRDRRRSGGGSSTADAFKTDETQKSGSDPDPDEALMRTGVLFGGLVKDVKRKWPWFASDFKDALHVQTIASIIYIYLATITKAITFGGFLGDITQGLQGVLESFLGHAVAGGFFCLFGGQPLTVLGCTGPVLIFEKILVDFCTSYSLDYMNFRLWIGLWSSLFCLVIVATDASAIVRYFTRFTEESFAALIGIIFIVESLKKLFYMSKKYPVQKGFDPDWITLADQSCSCQPPGNSSAIEAQSVSWNNLTLSQCTELGGTPIGDSCPFVPDIFFFSVILFFGTFALAFGLKKFKFTPYFPAKVRAMISDYAVIIAILVFVGVDLTFDLHTPKLIVPTKFKPTRSDVRGWIVPFFLEGTPIYLYFAAIIPALLLTILLFMDQQITSVIVNRSEHKLKKGCGYHLDMLIVGLMVGACSIFGLPWCVAATVLCLGHVDSLKMETETSAPGERPQFLGVREQRVTGTMVFVLTGLSVKLAPVLKFIPMPVLYGVLMYMGIASLRGMQFIDRIGLLFMPPKHQPDHVYLRHVPLKKVHLFTLIQISSLLLLWIIKSTPASLVFPLMVLALVGLRKSMDSCPGIFSQNDLFWLDNLMPDKVKSKKARTTSTNEDDEEKDFEDRIPVKRATVVKIKTPTKDDHEPKGTNGCVQFADEAQLLTGPESQV